MKDNNLTYRLIRLFCFLLKFIFRVKFHGKENIPAQGRIILAGNHISNLDPEVLLTSTKRHIHFLAKKELLDFPQKVLFSRLGIIPVDRSKHDAYAIKLAIDCLNNNQVVGIFPEGTTEKGRGFLPFKHGVIKIAFETNSKIIPFKIIGNYNPFKGQTHIIFGNAIKIKEDSSKEKERLQKIIENLRK